MLEFAQKCRNQGDRDYVITTVDYKDAYMFGVFVGLTNKPNLDYTGGFVGGVSKLIGHNPTHQESTAEPLVLILLTAFHTDLCPENNEWLGGDLVTLTWK